MPRNLKGLVKTQVGTVPTRPSALSAPGQPNGRPSAAGVPTHLPYGERGELENSIRQTPKQPAGPRPPGRATPPPPTDVDYSAPGAFEQHIAPALAGYQPNVTPLTAPTERPGEHPSTGLVGQPDSVLGQPQPGNVGDLLQQAAMMTGSAGLAALATRLQATGV